MLDEVAAAGLAKTTGGRSLEELVVLGAAVALVVGAAEYTQEPAIVVAGPAGLVVPGFDLAAQVTVADLILAVDTALRAASAVTGSGEELRHAVLVRSAEVGEGQRVEESRRASIELLLCAVGPGGGRELRAEADLELFETWFLDVWLRAVAAMLAEFTEPGRLLAALLPGAAKDLSSAARCGRRGFQEEPAAETLTVQVRAMVGEHPERPAIVAGTASLTYRAMWRSAEGVAFRLAELGIGRGGRVAVLAGNSVYAVPAILGSMLAGAACVPLDARSPAESLAGILADAECGAVLVTPDLAGSLSAWNHAHAVDLESAVRHGPRFAESDLPEPSAEDLAYVMYDPESAGAPKGVEIRQRAAASYVSWKLAYDRLSLDARLLQLESLTSGSSVSDIFSVLSSGGCIVLAEEQRVPSRQAVGLVAEHGITHLTIGSGRYQMLLDEFADAAQSVSLRLVTVIGTVMPPDLMRKHHQVLPGVRLVSEYGPAENSAGAIVLDHRNDATTGCPIGRPITNTVVTVTGADGRPLPAGFVGELRLAGHGLADGYRNRPDLTAVVFAAAPDPSGRRSYRTGDLAWWRPDGILEYAGRVDDRVAIRGEQAEHRESQSMAMARAADAGQDDLEAVIGAIFDETLGGGPFEPDTDFFLRGGHSLLALAVLDLIEERLGVCIELGDFFANATVRKTTELVRQVTAAQVATPEHHLQVRGAGDPGALLRLINDRAR